MVYVTNGLKCGGQAVLLREGDFTNPVIDLSDRRRSDLQLAVAVTLRPDRQERAAWTASVSRYRGHSEAKATHRRWKVEVQPEIFRSMHQKRKGN